ncbi:amidase-like protein [Penicillium angulare]|uniref:Amidase-like protein n=1 Tax=Penicillium angulare TaxID=116970 RepID=A0A9W9F6R5_9EURO|nr:amidase-like protein [Penicillium angulare]
MEDSIVFVPAHKLQDKLTTGEITSVQLVQAFLNRIERHNHQGLGLKAVISTCPIDIALNRAKELDDQRRIGQVRSELHGIPIVLKDAILTDPSLGMPTTVGSMVFSTLKAQRNASLVDKLIDAGMIILAKTNMTEFCGLKSKDTPVGWSQYGGQTLSPFREKGLDEKDQPTAGGSSSGSAVCISAGFAPLAIGTETAGSTVYPASVNGLYGLKLSREVIPTDGIFKLSNSFDCIGIMARDPKDLATLFRVLVPFDVPKSGSTSLYPSVTNNSNPWLGLQIGIVDTKWGVHESMSKGKWDLPDVIIKYEVAGQKMGNLGARVVYPFHIPEADILKHDSLTLRDVSYHEFPSQVEEFLQNFHPNEIVKSLEDIIAWNSEHDEKERLNPNSTQTELVASLKAALSPDVHSATVSRLRQLATVDGMEKWMTEYDVEFVLAPSDSTLVSFAACAGCPIATIPLGRLKKNNQPYGFFVLAKGQSEERLLHLMEIFYASFGNIDRLVDLM